MERSNITWIIVLLSTDVHHSLAPKELQQEKTQVYSELNQKLSSLIAVELSSDSSDKAAQHKHNLIIITITDESEGSIRVAPIAAIKYVWLNDNIFSPQK